MFLPAPNLIKTDAKNTLSPGWLVPAGSDTTSLAGFEVPEEVRHFFRVELHVNLSWELGLPLWGALYPSGNAYCPASTHSALQLLRSLLQALCPLPGSGQAVRLHEGNNTRSLCSTAPERALCCLPALGIEVMLGEDLWVVFSLSSLVA